MTRSEEDIKPSDDVTLSNDVTRADDVVADVATVGVPPEAINNSCCSTLPFKLFKFVNFLGKKKDFIKRRKNAENDTAAQKRITIYMGLRQKPSNWLHTHHYSIIMFLPCFLLNQFKQFANFVFLLLTILRTQIRNAAFGNEMIAPLCFILACTLVREIFEDIIRRIRDRKVNRQFVYAHTDQGWQETFWSSLHVGQIIQVKSGEQLPADLLILATSEPGNIAYIDTANLDGESNLKVRQAVVDMEHLIDEATLETFWNSSTSIHCDAPNRQIHECDGYIETGSDSTTSSGKSGKATPDRSMVAQKPSKTIEFSINNMLLRGSRLKNTKHVYGVVIYTGKDTKLSKNNTKKSPKRSTMSDIVNWVMVTQFGILIILCAVNALVSRLYPAMAFIDFAFAGNHAQLDLYTQFSHSLIMFSGFVPISLYVTIEVVEVLQGIFINWDLEMKNEKGKGVEVKMFSLNSDLGKIKYIMSDKTGTLTQNSMHFRMCSVGGLKYANRKSKRKDKFSPRKLLAHMTPNNKYGLHNVQVRNFLTACAVCHTVTPEHSETESSVRPIFHATSPDELALVNFAADANFIFVSRSPKKLTVDVAGVEETYEMRCLMEFNSDRKRMSVLVVAPDGQIKLFCKGADHIIFSRLGETPAKVLRKTQAHLQSFAVNGYRTLCFAGRTLSKEQYEEFETRFETSKTSCDRKAILANLFDDYERDLELYGVSAIEDKLQDQAPRTISKMLEAGIRVWVLTGDKLETAINIGNSCKLIDIRAPMLVLNATTRQETEKQMEEYIAKMGERLKNREQQISMIVDATTLDFVLEDDDLCITFLQLALCCSSVICCRCTPLQKATVTRMVRDNVSGSVLAIGDGANDVPMIQEAQIGVAIAGKEGMQAALAADYVVSQFKHLERLLLVHGTLSVFRTSKTVMFCLYKNILETFMMALFCYYNGRSSQMMGDPWMSIFYNVCFTSWCSLMLGIADRPATTSFLVKYPRVYTAYQNHINVPIQSLWLFSGICNGFTTFYITRMTFSESSLLMDGRELSIYVFGYLIYFSTLSVANFKALLETTSITMLSVIAAAIAFTFFVVVLFFQSFFQRYFAVFHVANENEGIIFELPYIYMCLLFLMCVVASLLPDLTFHLFTSIFKADVRQQIQWSAGIRGPNLHKLYQPIYKICDVVGIRVNLETGKHGFAFAQDDGKAVTQQQIIDHCKETTEQPKHSRSDKTVESSTRSDQQRSPPENSNVSGATDGKSQMGQMSTTSMTGKESTTKANTSKSNLESIQETDVVL
ncbi:unnamed protein product [Caenorhabditis auriculariae]|uniref:Phospholipid-transporting ATPase n=1 Tax=Caenorhabditis auriculariae TaxID=2777116 RepID=A0A8S1H4C6_9PELO|nr:unnamed protein product [Caenorhabditis auriculariae]